MSIIDNQTEDNESGSVTLENTSQKMGDLYPFIMINDYMINPNLLDSFYLNYNTRIPEISITFRVVDGIFMSKHFPKDRDLISIMIRSKNDDFTPIRQDFLITQVLTGDSFNASGEKQNISISGVLNVPKLYHEFCKSYKKQTSFDCLLEVSDELNLGFSTNLEDTNDIQTWINPFHSYVKFINDVTNHSYLNDDSFMTHFIDCYYRLNLINVQDQYNHDNSDLDDGLISSFFSTDHDKYSGEVKHKLTKLILSNYNEIETSNNYIQGYTLINDSGNIIINDGYKRILQFYDNNDKSFKSHSIDTLDTPNSNNKIILKGRKGENFYENENKYKWLGYLNNDNLKIVMKITIMLK